MKSTAKQATSQVNAEQAYMLNESVRNYARYRLALELSKKADSPMLVLSIAEQHLTDAYANVRNARKLRLARELTNEAFTFGTSTERFTELNRKLCALR